MEQDPNREKRGYERRGIHLPCQVRSENGQWSAKILDLSLKGAFVEVEAELEAGEQVELVCSADKHPLHLKGEVRHRGWFLLGFRNANGLGVEFDELSEDTRRRLVQMLQQSDQPAGSKFSLER